MRRLGFPADDQHLILNDSVRLGKSKEAARQAIAAGSDAYPNGQRADENTHGTAVTVALEPHSIVMMLGDNLADFTEDFSADGLDAVSRAERTGGLCGPVRRHMGPAAERRVWRQLRLCRSLWHREAAFG